MLRHSLIVSNVRRDVDLACMCVELVLSILYLIRLVNRMKLVFLFHIFMLKSTHEIKFLLDMLEEVAN